MIFTDRTITVRKGESRIDEPIVVYRGDYELEVRFTILNSKFRFMSGTNLIESEKASYGQLAILTPYGGNIFSDVIRCNDGSVTFVLTAEMLNQIEEVGLYSFQIRLMDYNKESRVSIPPIEFGIEVREPIASEDHDNSVNNAIVGYSIAKVVDPKEENVGDTFDENGNYNKTQWETGDRISEGKLNKIEDAIDKVNRNEKNDVVALDKRVTNNFNVLESTKADKTDLELQKTRIDNITSLAVGSTSGDAELIDGRLSFNNVQYNNLGDSIREQVSHLNDKIDYNADDNRMLNNLFEPTYVIDNYDVLNSRKLVGDGNGYIINEDGWILKRYDVSNHDYIYINISGGYQFQTELSSRNINIESDRNRPINIIGDPVMGVISSIVKVPEKASWLAVSIPESEESNYHVLCAANTADRKNALDTISKNDDSNILITLDACNVYPIILSNNAPSTYECPTAGGDTSCSLSYQEFIDTFFGRYVGVEFDDGYKVSKRSLGRDSSNKYDVFEYDFCPPRYNRTVLLSSGMNANELPGEFGLAYFMKSVMENPEDGYRYLYNNVRFKIIPVLCPWSFDQSPLLYDNFNGVSLNQNFDYRGSWDTVSGAGSDRKGEYACDQAETQIILKWLNQNAYKAELWIDAHTSPFGITGTAPLYYTITSDSTTNSKVTKVQTKITQAYVNAGYFTSGTENTNNNAGVAPSYRYPKHLYSYHECGIPSIMIEQYTGNPLYGGVNELSNTKADIDNYVTMLRAYTLALLERSAQPINIIDLYWKVYQMYNELHSLDTHMTAYDYITGSIDNSGNYKAATNRCTRRPLYVNPGDNIKICVADDYELVEIHEYKADGTWIRRTINNVTKITASESTGYIKYIIKRSDEASMHPSELDGKVSVAVNGIMSDNDNFVYGTISSLGVITIKYNRVISTPITLTGDGYVELIGFNRNMYTLIDVAVYDSNDNFVSLDAGAKRRAIDDKVIIHTHNSKATSIRFSFKRHDEGEIISTALDNIKIITY